MSKESANQELNKVKADNHVLKKEAEKHISDMKVTKAQLAEAKEALDKN